jgi:uncharacterized membrane protein YfcA
MDLITELVLGVAIGFCIGLTGIGGGVLVLPALTVVLSVQPSAAAGTASLYAFLTKVYASYHHFKLKTVDMRLSLLILAGALPADLATSCLVNWLANTATSQADFARLQIVLKGIMSAVIVLSALLMLARLVFGRRHRRQPDTGLPALLSRHPGLKTATAIASGALVGALIGATSIGGGVIIVPLLIMLFGLSSSRTVGTSIFIAVVLTMVAAAIYGMGAQLEALTAMIMAVGSLVGVPIGSRLSVRTPEKPLQWVLAGIILFSAVMMQISQTH